MGEPFLAMLRKKRASAKHKAALDAAPRFKNGKDGISGIGGQGSGGRSIFHDEMERRGH